MKHTPPTLSIVTLTYNRAALLEKNFKSLLGQLEPRDEIIVINNGSTDQTNTVISNYKRLLPINAYTVLKGKYPYLYNVGIRHAKNDIIVFLDDDCIADASFLKQVRKAHQNNPNTIIQGMTYSIPKGNIYVDVMGDHYHHFMYTNLLDSTHLRILDNKNASISRTQILKLNGFCEKLDCGSEDIEFGIRARSHGIPILLDASIIAYHHERTKYKDFVKQHIRFATCEHHLDSLLPKHERFGLFRAPKLKGQIQSAIRRELFYLQHRRVVEAIILPFLYITLACIRVWGYARHR